MYDLASFGLTEATLAGIHLRKIGDRVATLEDASQEVARFFCEEFRSDATGDSAFVLARCYQTVPLGELTPELASYARGVFPGQRLDEHTRCLTLLGTFGDRPEWQRRERSRGHRAIPLADENALANLPMVARLTESLGLRAAEVVRPDPAFLRERDREGFNVFYVENASGSPYIPAQDHFVAAFGVCSVIGFGFVMPPDRIFATILFARRQVSSATADLFKTVALNLKLGMLRFAAELGPHGGELDVLRIQAATLGDALSVHEEQAARQFEIIRAQRHDLEDRTRALQHALDELGQSQAALVRAERMAVLGQLAASVGHELRNPLAAIRNGNAYIAKRLRRDAADDKMLAFTTLIERELDACTRIIGDLLDFARERALILAPTPLHALVAEAIALVPPSKSQLCNEVTAELPLAVIDRQQFRQVLLNLIQNAVDAMEPRGGGTITASADCTGAAWSLRIEDDGPGMPPDVAARVFEPLFTTKVKGTGLGLAIVSGIVSRHGGTIQIDSVVGRGTRFVIQWPREVRPAPDPAPTKPEQGEAP